MNFKKLSIIPFIIIAVIILIPTVVGLAIAFKDYKPFLGFAESAGVGFENFSRFFEYKYAGRILSNSFTVGIISMIVGAIYVFIAVIAINSIRNFFVKGIVTFLFTIPALISPVIYQVVIGKISSDILLNSDTAYVFSSCVSAFRYAALFALCGMFIKRESLDGAIKTSLVFVAFSLTKLFVGDFDIAYLFQNPTTYETTEVLSTYIYQTGLVSNNFSFGAAIDIITILLQIIPAIIAIIMVSFIFNDKPHIGGDVEFAPLAATGIVPFAILCTALLFQVGGDPLTVLTNEWLATSMGNSLIIALFSAGLVVIFSILMANFIVDFGTAGIAGGFMILLCANCTIGSYIFTKTLGIIDTHIGVILNMLQYVPVIAIVFAFVLKERQTPAKCISLIISSFGVLFAWVFGVLKEPLMYLNDEAKYPISIVVRQIANMSHIDKFEGASASTDIFSALLIIIIPVIVAGIFIMAGAFFDEKFGDN